MRFLFILLLPIIALAGPRKPASAPALKQCLKSLSYDPATPGYPKSYFQDLGGQESFTLRCHLPDGKDFMRFAFVTDTTIKSLKLPIYYYQVSYSDGGSDSTDLPRNLIHFKHGPKDMYIRLEYADLAHLFPAEKLPVVAKEEGFSLAKVQSEYVKKYETWLKTQKAEKSILLRDSSDEEITLLTPCLEEVSGSIAALYLEEKFKSKLPAYGTINNDLKNQSSLSEAAKQKYKRPFSEIEADYYADLGKSHPSCEGFVSDETVKKSFSKRYEKSRAPYEALRRNLFQ